MWLIATDEAGYGPTLGPLIVAGTLWEIPPAALRPDAMHDPAALQAVFQAIRSPNPCQGRSIVVDDSKAIYRSGDGLESLHAAVSASHHWCGRTETTLQQWLPHAAPDDIDAIAQTPWLSQLSQEPFLEPAATEPLRKAWSASGITQLATRVRIITAARFNQICAAGANKADLLSETTIELVRQLLQGDHSQDPAIVFCDRHGGRRYYAGVLQHVFPDAIVRVIAESNRQSVYELNLTQGDRQATKVRVHFSVKGDSFTPVALSSMHAKYLRERFMQSLNDYFRDRQGDAGPLRPTAGYPVDADRFLTAIARTIRKESISPERLIRSR